MPSGRTLEAGKAVIKLSLQDKVSDGLNKVGKKMKVLGGVAAAAGGSIVTAFAAATKSFIETGDQLNDMSVRTGFAVKTLSKLSYAASQSGTSLEAVEKAARGMAKLLTSASLGAASSAQTLETLGVSLDTIKGLSPDQQFQMLAAAVANVKDPTTRAAMAMRVFGKSGADLLPMLANGAAGMEEMFAEAEKLGLVLSEEDAKAAAELDDALNKLQSQIKGIMNQIGIAVAGPLGDFGENLSEVLRVVVGFAKENPTLVKGVAALGAAAVVTGGAVVVLGTALTAIASAPVIAGIVALTTAVAGLALAFGDVEQAIADARRMLLRLQGMSPEGIKAMETVEKHFKRWTPPKASASGGAAAGTPISLGAPGTLATPSIDPMQGQLARLGLNGYTPNTSDPSGRAGAQLLKQGALAAWDAISSKAAEIDSEFGISKKVAGAKDALAAAMEEFGKGGESSPGKAFATLDARNAIQQFGRQSKSEELLADIRDNTKKAADAKGGIPVI